MKKVVLHIGQSKTGTTAIQSFLAMHRESLREKSVLYPDVFRNRVALKVECHNSLAESLRGVIRHPHLTAKEYFAQFSAQVARTGCDTLLLSAEGFWGVPQIWRLPAGLGFMEAHAQKLETLRRHLDVFGCPVHIIVYLRRQDKWLESAAGHIIRYEGLTEESLYHNDRQFADLMAPCLDYAAMLDLWQRIIQPATMTVIPYEPVRLLGENVVRDFLHRTEIEMEIDTLPPAAEIHASMGRDYLWLKKVLNRIPKNKTAERTIIACLTALDQRCGSHRSWRLDPTLKREVLARCAAGNRILATKYGAGGEFFSPKDAVDSGKNNDGPVSVPECLATLMAFDEAWVSPDTRFLYVLNGFKALLRNRLPLLHTLARRMLLWFQRQGTNPATAKGVR